eukprot:1908475-Amphidinium_carterae.1
MKGHWAHFECEFQALGLKLLTKLLWQNAFGVQIDVYGRAECADICCENDDPKAPFAGRSVSRSQGQHDDQTFRGGSLLERLVKLT